MLGNGARRWINTRLRLAYPFALACIASAAMVHCRGVPYPQYVSEIGGDLGPSDSDLATVEADGGIEDPYEADAGIEGMNAQCTPDCTDGFVCVLGKCLNDCTGTVVFPDENLETTVRAAIGKTKGEISYKDLVDITLLQATIDGVEDLTGLECMTSVQELDLSTNRISDIRPLSVLQRLETIVMTLNYVVDIGPLYHLDGLKVLGLGSNDITDISGIENLERLEKLFLPENSIEDISPLAGLVELKMLTLNGNEISDLAPLASNPGIGDGDEIMVTDNPIDCDEQSEEIREIRLKGAKLLVDCP